MTFTYRYGDRPLEGYTILRGIGRGGFGEVYYAVSDGGREVALKSIHQNHEIELRGVRHCMNLKCPQLVTIFDVLESSTARGGTPSGPFPAGPFIVMEYVDGPSLRDILDESPAGLGEEEAAFLVAEVARGLAYLHEHGIVHRDLKPENIFYEDGYVKIGDYGLSKYISASRHSGQTISVGTVHYMAPEIGSGDYHRGIDLYALGIILYELITGRVPFEGKSAAEILTKHLSSEADVAHLGAACQWVIVRALQKNPADRYADAASLAADLLADPAFRERVAAARRRLPRYARRAAVQPARGASRAAPDRARLEADTVTLRSSVVAPPAAGATGAALAPPGELDEPAGDRIEGSAPRTSRSPARGERGSRALVCGGICVVAATLLDLFVALPLSAAARLFFYLSSILAGVAAVFLVENVASPQRRLGNRFGRRLAVAAAAAAVLTPFYSLFVWGGAAASAVYPFLPALLAGLFTVDWHERVRPTRRERLLLGAAFRAAAAGAIFAVIFGGDAVPLAAAGILGAISLAVNAGAPFAAGAARAVSAVRRASEASLPAAENLAELKERLRSEACRRPAKHLYRPASAAILGGVCAGLARYMDVHPWLVRTTFVFFSVLTWGWALIAYLIFWCKLPAAEPVSSASVAARGPEARAVSPLAAPLWIVLGLGLGTTLLVAFGSHTPELLGIALEREVAGIGGWFLLSATAYSLLRLLTEGRRTVWRPLLGAPLLASLVLCGIAALRVLISSTLPPVSLHLSGRDLSITVAVVVLAAHLAIRAPGLFFSPLPPLGSRGAAGQPTGAAAWGLVGTTLVLAGVLTAVLGVMTSTGVAEAVLREARVERYEAVIAFGQNREHFLLGLVLFLPGLFCHLAARRWAGGLHVLRGTLGLVGAGLVVGALAVLAPEYVHVNEDFRVTVRHQVRLEGMALIYLMGVFSLASLKWPGRAVWSQARRLAASAGAPA